MAADGGDGAAAAARPVLRVVRGAPDEAELAALTAVLLARAAAAAPEPPLVPGPGWRDLRLQLRRAPVVGPGEWVAGGRRAGVRTRADW